MMATPRKTGQRGQSTETSNTDGGKTTASVRPRAPVATKTDASDNPAKVEGTTFYPMQAEIPAEKRKDSGKSKGILVIYTGGTVGSMPVDPADPDSPQVVVPWDEFSIRTPELDPNADNFIGYRIDAYAFDEPLDSCNVGAREWQMMARIIAAHHDDYEGFVILHGTDSMIYTASALSFMLMNLKRPVIITGAQRAHLFQSRNDAMQNMITAMSFANPVASDVPVVPEVCIFFEKWLLRGNRARKKDASGYEAYFTPNFPPLGFAGNKLIVDKRLILKQNDLSFQLHRHLDESVLTFDVYPGIQNTTLARDIIGNQNVKGVVLRAYGSGNIPTKPEFLEVFREADQRGIIVQNVTQCLHGFVELGMYETSAELLEVGMVTGFDITPEAALCKMMVLLADEDLTVEEKKRYAQQSLAGEMSRSLFIQSLKHDRAVTLSQDNEPLRLAPSGPIEGKWAGERIENASVRLYEGSITTKTDQPITIEIYLNVRTGDELSRSSPNFAGAFKRHKSRKKLILAFDITDAARRLVKAGDRVSVTLRIAEGEGSMFWSNGEVAVFINEHMF